MKHLEFAIEMELEGQRYYLEQAEIFQDSELKTIFLILADAEKEHAALLLRRKNEEPVILKEESILPGMKSIFRELPRFKEDEIKAAKQLDVYRFAALQEEKSIDLYQGMLEEVTDPRDKELFAFLVKEEKEHLILFEELVTMLTRPEEWVESAEFGIREEY